MSTQPASGLTTYDLSMQSNTASDEDQHLHPRDIANHKQAIYIPSHLADQALKELDIALDEAVSTHKDKMMAIDKAVQTLANFVSKLSETNKAQKEKIETQTKKIEAQTKKIETLETTLKSYEQSFKEAKKIEEIVPDLLEICETIKAHVNPTARQMPQNSADKSPAQLQEDLIHTLEKTIQVQEGATKHLREANHLQSELITSQNEIITLVEKSKKDLFDSVKAKALGTMRTHTNLGREFGKVIDTQKQVIETQQRDYFELIRRYEALGRKVEFLARLLLVIVVVAVVLLGLMGW